MRVFYLFLVIVLLSVMSLKMAIAQADRFPSKPIKLLIHEGAGGTIDVPYRPLAKAAEKILGQPIVCLNNPGGGGTRALGVLLNEKPDGYTLSTIAVGSIIAVRIEKLNYSITDNFTPIIHIQGHPLPVALKKDAPWDAWQEFIKYTREHKGEVKISVWGAKSLVWLALTQIEKIEKVNFIYIPYASSGEAMAAILGGHITATTGGSAIMYAKSGELKVLLLFAERRLKSLPNVPTAKELYKLGGVFTGGFSGIVAPKGLPEPIRIKLHDAFQKAMEDEEYLKLVDKYDLIISHKNSEEFGKLIKEFDREIKEVIKE